VGGRHLRGSGRAPAPVGRATCLPPTAARTGIQQRPRCAARNSRIAGAGLGPGHYFAEMYPFEREVYIHVAGGGRIFKRSGADQLLVREEGDLCPPRDSVADRAIAARLRLRTDGMGILDRKTRSRIQGQLMVRGLAVPLEARPGTFMLSGRHLEVGQEAKGPTLLGHLDHDLGCGGSVLEPLQPGGGPARDSGEEVGVTVRLGLGRFRSFL